MRENVDFISMETYAADMGEQADSAAGIIREMRRRIDDRDLFLAALVASNGGEMRLSNSSLYDAHKLTLVQEIDMARDAIIIRTEQA